MIAVIGMKKKTVFILSTVLALIVFALLVTIVIPKRKYSFPIDTDKLNIVIVGDSIFANGIDDVNIGECLEKELDCEIQNSAIGGSSATNINYGREVDYYINQFCFSNLADIICSGNTYSVTDNPTNVAHTFHDATVKTLYLAATDLNNADYLIINYGINDGFNKIPVSSSDKFDETTFSGTMRAGIDEIVREYPNLKIIVCEVIYTNGVIKTKGKDIPFDGNVDSWCDNYNKELRTICSEFDNVEFFAISDYFDINENTYEEYLADGLHFTGERKKEYAKYLADYIRSR